MSLRNIIYVQSVNWIFISIEKWYVVNKQKNTQSKTTQGLARQDEMRRHPEKVSDGFEK